MAFRLHVHNFGPLRDIDWSPSGVCGLVGANGSGKTTLLRILEFFELAQRRGLDEAFNAFGGPGAVRHVAAADDEGILVAVEHDGVCWELRPVIAPTQVIDTGERVLHRSEPILDAIAAPRRGHKLRLPTLAEVSEEASVTRPLVALVDGYRLYQNYHLWPLQKAGSQMDSASRLHVSGANAFSVLRNWRDARSTRDRYEFVVDGLERAFPGEFVDLDFETAGTTVTLKIFGPDWRKVGIPVSRASSGLVVGLLHLCAVASADRGGVIGIDEFGNSLHPHAVHELLACIRERATEEDITVLLATHSVSVIDEFSDRLDKLFVIESSEPRQPAALTELYDPEWLRRFRAGLLYERGDFGAPRGP